jgi:hypothetical protein
VDDSAAYGDYYQWGRAKDGHQSSAADGENTKSKDIVSSVPVIISAFDFCPR